MREIKFRVWDKKEKKMYSPVIQIDFDYGEVILERYEEDNKEETIMWKRIEGVKLMQFTGLRDKNGKEIYEGDIVVLINTMETIPCEVVWNKEGRFNIKSEAGHFYSPSCECEVIGNIYEKTKSKQGED